MIDRRTAALLLCFATYCLAASVVTVNGEIPRGPVSDEDLATMTETRVPKVDIPRSPEADSSLAWYLRAGFWRDAAKPTLTTKKPIPKSAVEVNDASVTHQRSRRCADVEGTEISRCILRSNELCKCCNTQCGPAPVFLVQH